MKRYHSIARLSLAALLAFAMAAPSYGAETQTSTSQASEQEKPRSERPWWIYGSAAGGFGNITGDEFGQDPTGAGVFLAGLVSYKIPKWVIDMGAGWMSTSVEGKNMSGASLTINTKSGLAELSPRFRLTENLQLGLSLFTLFGTDTGFSGRVDQSSFNFMLGPKLTYEIPTRGLHLRLFVQLMNSLGLEDRNALFTIAGIQAGLPLGREPAPLKDQVVLVQAAPAPKAIFTPTKIELTEEVKFRHASDVLLPSSQVLLDEVADVIKRNRGAFKRITVEGHTNYLGTFEYNQDLSERRAASVLEYLVSRGVTKEELDSVGWGKTRPKKGIENLSKAAQRVANRRVEFTVVP